MPAKHQSRYLGYLALLGNTILWGLAIPIVKKGFDGGLSPTFFLLSRFYLAILFSLPIVYALKNRTNTKKTFKQFLPVLLIEFLGNALALFFLYEGVKQTSAVESSLIASAWPIFTVLGGVFFLKEKEQKHEVLGLSLALVGTFLLVGRPLLTNHSSGSSLTGNFLVLAHDITTATYTLLAKRFYKSLNLWTVSHLSFWGGAVSFTTLFIIQGHSLSNQLNSIFLNPSPWPLLSILYMAIFGSIVGLTLYLIGQNKIEASEASLFTYLQPIIAIPASIFLLSETIQPLEILAIVITILGVYIAEKRT